MCGIAGVFDTRGQKEIDASLLDQMNQAQFHRGPDEGGTHREPGVGLAHRRLSIIDLSHGQQPLFSQDGNLVVVYNGEIYNFREIRTELSGLGYQFQTHCDTEVIVYAWDAWGEACVDRFRGMFAFALWDRRQETLFLARDRMGIKPLFYSLLPSGELVFASELKSLQVYPGLPNQHDPQAIEEYFALGYIPEPKTIYQNVYKLPPAHTLKLVRGQEPVLNEYWDIPFKLHQGMTEGDAKAELVTRLKEAVDIRLVSEVPLGAFLSGGVDSSAVVALMAGLQEDSVNTCSISFDEPSFDESDYAKQVADQYQTNHRVRELNTEDYSLVDQLADLYDEPFADSSAMPTYRVCELARENVTVALSGDGGDEAMAGYRRYRWHMNEERLRGLLPTGVRRPLFKFLGNAYPKADWAPRIFRAKTTFQALARDPVEGYFHNISILTDNLRSELYGPKLKQQLQGYNAIEVFRRHAEKAPTDDPLSLIQYIDMKTYLVGDILTKVDRASMAHSLEVRVPLLDHKFIEWVSGLPSSFKLNGQQGKHIFKKSMESHLSNDILYRQKMGFAVPLAKWFRGPLKQRVRDSLLGSSMADSGYFNNDYLAKLVSQHEQGVRDHSAALWSLLMFEAFLRRQGA